MRDAAFTGRPREQSLRGILLIRMSSSMGSPYKALQIWVKHFLGYLVYELFLRPKSWRGSLYIYLLLFPRFWTLSVEMVLIFILTYSEWRDTENEQKEIIRDPSEDGVFFRVFYRNLALLHLRFLLLPFIILLQNKHTTLAENGENLISAQPRISAHL